MIQQQRIAVIIPEGLSAYGSGIAKGIAEFARAHGRWRLYALIGRDGDFATTRPLDADAAIVWNQDYGLLRKGTPRVFVSSNRRSREAGWVCADDVSVGAMVADHLLECGLRRFSFVGPDFSHPRCVGFREKIGQVGGCFIEFPVQIGLNLSILNADWDVDMEHLAEWIASLPKPVGLMAYNDVVARRVTTACKLADCLVPEQVAIVGVDNNDLLCDLSDPALSSVDRGARRAGRQAAALLASMLNGEPPPSQPILIPPAGIVARRSSDMLAIEDAEIAAVVRFIREHAAEPLRISDILDEVPVARRSLERRFRKIMGRSLHAEVHRVRIERAKDLLVRTSLPIPRVAASSGFNSPEHFTSTFKSTTGLAPTGWRQRHAAD